MRHKTGKHLQAVAKLNANRERRCMPFVSRDRDGSITAVHEKRFPRSQEVPRDDPDLRAFLLQQLGAAEDGESPDAMAQSDREMSRVIEDLVDLMIAKRLISFAELPRPAQQKLLRRRELRGHVAWLNSIVADEKLI